MKYLVALDSGIGDVEVQFPALNTNREPFDTLDEAISFAKEVYESGDTDKYLYSVIVYELNVLGCIQEKKETTFHRYKTHKEKKI